MGDAERCGFVSLEGFPFVFVVVFRGGVDGCGHESLDLFLHLFIISFLTSTACLMLLASWLAGWQTALIVLFGRLLFCFLPFLLLFSTSLPLLSPFSCFSVI